MLRWPDDGLMTETCHQ